jgi:hypothetical protein
MTSEADPEEEALHEADPDKARGPEGYHGLGRISEHRHQSEIVNSGEKARTGLSGRVRHQE